MIGLAHFLVVGAGLFCLGLYCVLTRRNAIGVLMGIELILNSANVNAIAFSKFGTGNPDGQVLGVIMLAAAEAAIGLAIVLGIYRRFRSIDVRGLTELRG